ncbi:PepSY-associated TM helix domain-containing protein [Pseudomonas caspiana]|uniref:Peptidase n=2 Tax=Pseudomonas caspiana TaxID=1451454 RepID=A0A1Y3P1B2_9PSED|nr:PepSY-associated TM helix domain-containing protein [Pseudomonas caspiana]OUM73616.1 peptidase [Pseudomonas caspiana]
MSWLHTWCGLVCGWLLCAIFLTGTLSVFREPITRWMEAQPLVVKDSSAVSDGTSAARYAERYLVEHASGARFWRVEFPQYPGQALQLAWRSGSTLQQVSLSAETGEILPIGIARKTEGGRHFMSFHYMLHLPVLGFWLVGWLTVGMLVALVSGVVIHRRIFQDFFTFRANKGLRSWLDAHNATAVMTLPFLLMIAYTGLAIFYTSYMPWPLQTAYGSGPNAYSQFQSELSGEAASVGEPNNAATDWPSLLRQAQTSTGQDARMLLVQNPGTQKATVRVMGRHDEAHPSQTLFTPQASVLFDGVTGATLQVQKPLPETMSLGDQIYGVLRSLHFAEFGGWGMKWLYFVSGMLGMAMMATGTLLFTIKRRNKSQKEFGAATARVYRCIEAFNVASIAGIGVACIGYFYANRFISADILDRATWEIRSFLLIWLATLVHALFRPAKKAWTEQLVCAAVLCICLPAVNFCTTGQHIGRYISAGDWQRGSVEIVALGFGVALVMALLKQRIANQATPSSI